MKIVISGTPASGKSSVAKLVAKKMGYRHYSMGDLQRELAREHGVDIVEWGRMEAQDPGYDRMIDERQTIIGRESENFVVDSRMGAFFIPSAVKFFVDADETVRAKRRLQHQRAEEMYSSTKDVKKEMARREGYNKERFLRYYKFDYTDKKNYDHVIDTSGISIEEAAERVMGLIKSEHLNMKRNSKKHAASDRY